LLETP